MTFPNKIIDLGHFNPSLINYINDVIKNNVFYNIIIVLEDTKSITPELLKEISKSNRLKFRIIGPYNNQRLSNKSKKEIEEIYSSITYSRDELYNILMFFRKIEDGCTNLGEFDICVYIYKALIRYFKYSLSAKKGKDNSLRCVLNKKPSSIGISLLFNEILKRKEINSYFVEGKLVSESFSKKHAWNIIEIRKHFIPADLYLDNISYKGGYRGLFLYFGEINSFAKSHIPSNNEVIQYYENALTSVSMQEINVSLNFIKSSKSKKYDVVKCEINDEEHILYASIEKVKINNKLMEKIVYFKNSSKSSNANILYLEENSNIKNVFNKLGDELVSSKVRILIRTDESIIIIEQILEEINKESINSNKYKIYEIIYEDNKKFVKESFVYTEKDLLNANEEEIIKYFSKKNLEYIISNNNGYLNYINPSEVKIVETK